MFSAYFLVNNCKSSKITFVSLNFRLFLNILKTTNIKTSITFYRKKLLENKKVLMAENWPAVILATSEFFYEFFVMRQILFLTVFPLFNKKNRPPRVNNVFWHNLSAIAIIKLCKLCESMQLNGKINFNATWLLCSKHFLYNF